MNRVARRAKFALVLAAVLLGGLVWFCADFLIHGSQWVVFSGSPHVYRGGNLDCGVVTDREGRVLLDMTNGRTYADDADLRRATIHILGDRYGNISAPALAEYSSQMVGYDLVNGIYTVNGKSGQASLTICAEAQLAALEGLNGRKGVVAVYNYKTGEILCMVSSPNYDPDNEPDIGEDTSGAYEGVYLNRFTQSAYVPGSIFKLVTTAAALEAIDDIEERTFYCEGTYDIGADTVVCEGYHGQVDLGQALTKSCNCAFAQLALELGPERLGAYARQFGITEPLEFDGITTASGSFDVSNAADVNVAWAAIGQYTDTVNPARFMTFMGQIAGGGKAAVPYLVDRVSSGPFSSYSARTKMTDAVMERETARRLAELMRDNVIYGYGDWNFPDISVCAKSGTAEVGGGREPNATFAGFAQDPDYPLAFVVVVENGGAGGATCAPIISDVLQACMDCMDRE